MISRMNQVHEAARIAMGDQRASLTVGAGIVRPRPVPLPARAALAVLLMAVACLAFFAIG